MQIFLLDTNIASYVLRNNPPEVRVRLAMLPIEQIYISSITEAELLDGAKKRNHSEQLLFSINTFVSTVFVAPWNSAAARQYSELRVSLEKSGQPLGIFDMMIAAHAKSLGAILVTNDKALLNTTGLQSENWVGSI